MNAIRTRRIDTIGRAVAAPLLAALTLALPSTGAAMHDMDALASQSALPGFPGASHLYPVGATGFFLDHPEHIALSTEQSAALNRIKEAAKIEGQIRAIEKLRGDQRMAFIRAVGAAAQVLTAEQRASLLGTRPATGAKPAPMKNM